MIICIMRHGEAESSASSDSGRALTNYGRQQCISVGNWLKKQNISFDLGLVSPYVRAQQSYREIASIIPVAHVETNELLVPGASPSHIADTLMMLPLTDIRSVLIVSHLPLVSYLVNELCPYISSPMFSTASIACITLSEQCEGTLEWSRQAE